MLEFAQKYWSISNQPGKKEMDPAQQALKLC